MSTWLPIFFDVFKSDFSANNDKIFKKIRMYLFQKMRQNLLFLDKIGILKRDLYLFHSKTSCEKKSDF